MNLRNEWFQQELQKSEESIPHRPLEEEYTFYQAVSSGDMDFVQKNCRENTFTNPEGMGILSANPLTNIKVSAKFWGVVDEKSGKFPGSSLSFINTAFPNYRAPRRHRFKLLIGHFVVRSCFKEILQIFLGIQPVCSGGL